MLWQDAISTPADPAFQDALDLLRAVLPQSGPWYCFSSIGPQTRWSDKAVQSIDDVVARAFANSASGMNTYFGLSAFTEGWHQGPKGKNVFRVQSNTAGQKALWLDVDAGKENSTYKDWREAASALGAFLKATGLPLPWIVLSGHGLHLYWPFSTTIRTDQWRALAAQLKVLCVVHGFDVDTTKTEDPSAVLRVPGTQNYDLKGAYGGVPTPVRLLRRSGISSPVDFAQILIKAVRNSGAKVEAASSSAPRAALPSAPTTAVPDGLSFDMSTFEGPPVHPYRIIKECEQVRTAGLGNYHQWYNMLLVMKHCAFGEQAAHDISKTDKRRYDVNVVAEKFRQAVDGGYGPCRCSTFNSKTPNVCTRCPYWGKITSPLQLGEPYHPSQKPVPMQPPVVAVSGDTAVVDGTGEASMSVVPFSTKEFQVVPGQGVLWFKKEKVAGGEGADDEDSFHYVTRQHLISDVEIYIHSLCVDENGPDVRRSYIIRKKAQGRAAEDILFDVTNDLGPTNMQKWLANHGMLPTHPKYAKPMGDFMQTYLAAVQNKLPEIRVRDSFGWVKNQDTLTGKSYDGFIVADRMYTSRGIQNVKLDTRAEHLAPDFRQVGHLDVWKFIPNMYKVLDQKFPALMMCASLAAPFMRLGNGVANNVAYSLWDIKGGKGKSTVLEACASVWGNPVTMLQTKSDTTSSRFQKFAVYRNLPVFVDEITNMSDAAMSDLVYDIVNGREKSRSTSTGTGLAKQGQWSTVTQFTSNKSLYEMLKSHRAQSDATCMRVIETQCDFKDYTGTKAQEYISYITRTIRRNYGLAGPALLEYALSHEEVMAEIQQWAEDFVTQHIKFSDERFWLYGVAIPLAVGRVAKRAGLLDYDIDGWLVPFVLNELLPGMRQTVKVSTATSTNILSDFFSDSLDNTLTVETARRPQSQPDPGCVSGTDLYVKTYPTRRITIRREMDKNVFYVSTKAFHKWCADNNYSVMVIMQDLERLGVLQGRLQYELGKHVRTFERARTQVYKLVLPEDI